MFTLLQANCQARTPSNSSRAATDPATFMTSLLDSHRRRSPKNFSRSSRMNWRIAVYSSRSESASTDCCIVGFGSGVMAYLRFLDIPACDMAIATACLRLFTTGALRGPLGSRPAWSVPALYSPIVFATFACLADLVFGVFILGSSHAFTAFATPLLTGQCIG